MLGASSVDRVRFRLATGLLLTAWLAACSGTAKNDLFQSPISNAGNESQAGGASSASGGAQPAASGGSTASGGELGNAGAGAEAFGGDENAGGTAPLGFGGETSFGGMAVDSAGGASAGALNQGGTVNEAGASASGGGATTGGTDSGGVANGGATAGGGSSATGGISGDGNANGGASGGGNTNGGGLGDGGNSASGGSGASGGGGSENGGVPNGGGANGGASSERTGGSSCQRSTEICDGVDNDCNSQIDENACPPKCTGFVAAGRHFMACSVVVAQADAASLCATHGMRLAWLDSLDKVNAVLASLQEQNHRGMTPVFDEVYIGATDAEQEGHWHWAGGADFWLGNGSGSAVNGAFSNWSSGRPNNFPKMPGENCAVSVIEFPSDGNPGQWNDVTCTEPHGALCEVP
ncbi:MAG TPA: C-type lectin domain-containing protein [Polyangiaceae bacterium]|nr:C-type lectin domain-containing protein [Polyangiaceae bacterium]